MHTESADVDCHCQCTGRSRLTDPLVPGLGSQIRVSEDKDQTAGMTRHGWLVLVLAVTCIEVGCRQSMTPTTNIWSRGADVSGALQEESGWSSDLPNQRIALASYAEPVSEPSEPLPSPSPMVPPEPTAGDRLPAIDESPDFLELFPEEPDCRRHSVAH